MSSPSDRDLILRARRADLEAFGELVIRYQAGVFNVCLRMTNERFEAEDLTQETFVRIYSRLSSFDLARPFGPWIRRAAANLCLNRLAGAKPEPAELDEERLREPGRSPEAIVEDLDLADQIHLALASLPPDYRAVIELRHFQELTYSEIAATLHIPLSDVKSHLFRGRKALAEKLSLVEKEY